MKPEKSARIIMELTKDDATSILKQRWIGKHGYSGSYDFIDKNYIKDFDYFYLIHHHTCKDVKKFYRRIQKLGLYNEIMLKGEDRVVSSNIYIRICPSQIRERVEFT